MTTSAPIERPAEGWPHTCVQCGCEFLAPLRRHPIYHCPTCEKYPGPKRKAVSDYFGEE